MKALLPSDPQPAPQPGLTNVLPLVVTDFIARACAGLRKYGTPLQTHNGRDALIDAYQEAQDLCLYLRQKIEEEKWDTSRLPAGYVAIPLAHARALLATATKCPECERVVGYCHGPSCSLVKLVESKGVTSK